MRKVFIILLLICLWMIMGCAASHYTLGKQHLEAEEYEQALAEFELAKQEQPDDPEINREMGIAYYKQLDFNKAIPLLLQSFLRDSTDGRTLFYLGTAFEITKKYDMAKDIYSRYVDVSPTAGIRSSIEGRLEKLIRLQMEEAAKKALADEKTIGVQTIPDSTVAVLYFQNMGNNHELDPIQKGLADMVITDLSKVNRLKVVERIQMQKLMEEMGLGMTGLVDEKTAPRVGKLLGASRLVKGTFMDLSGDKLRIDAGLIPIKTKSRFTMRKEEGQLETIFKMEKNLVFGLINRMGIQLSQQERDAIEIIPTENLLAFMAYCNALDYEDRGMYEQASEFYSEALMLDPNFSQAKEKLSTTENLSASTMDAAAFEHQLTIGESEEFPSGTTEEPPPEEAAEAQSVEFDVQPAVETPSINITNQMIHTVGVLDQVFLPGIESREPAQERSEPTFGSTAKFHVRVDIPAE